MAGYSKRSLVEKLGIKEGTSVCILNAPSGYTRTLGELPSGASVSRTLKDGLEFIQFFNTKRSVLEKNISTLRQSLRPAGILWVCWPKGSSKVPTDLNENVIRKVALAHRLVDVKVCAVDETWSGLKLVIRVKDR